MFPCSIDHNCKEFRKLIVVDVRNVGEGSRVVQGVLEVDIAGGSEVQLIGVCELHLLGLITCEGCDIVQSDHAPQAGVAQGIFDGELVRRQGRHQEEVEEELEEEIERRVRRDHSRRKTQVRMHGWYGMTHKARPWATSAMCDHCASTDGARRAQNCALYTSVCFVVSVPLFAMCSRLLMSVCRSQMFVNMRCRIHSLYRKWMNLRLGQAFQREKDFKCLF